ncbi:MAG: restriction endonuclease [Cytophagaceae bacterium]|nr:MAG: restriction endonuclease [Cytophagaceae bacterium]
MDVRIEVTATQDMSSTERGRLLEQFARRLLECQNYAVTTEVRITGQEVDLLAEEKSTGERIIVECKAYRSTISSDVIHKLFGQVMFKGFSSGWLITTYDLGKDAKGLRDEWGDKPPQERRKLQIYDPHRLIERLVKCQADSDA